MPMQALHAKAEFYLMLSRAFLPPMADAGREAFATALPEELREVGRLAGYGDPDALDAFAAEAARIAEGHDLLQIYSALFLVPPRSVHLHAAVYLDGAVLGRSADRLDAFYARHGLARSEAFRDLPDHLGAILEFLALLYFRAASADGEARAAMLSDARDLNRDFLLSWVPSLRRQLIRAGTPDENRYFEAPPLPVYARLADVLHMALSIDAGVAPAPAESEPHTSARPTPAPADPKRTAWCVDCGAEIGPVARIRRVRRVLEAQGIGTDHLAHCPRCRSGAMSPLAQAV